MYYSLKTKKEEHSIEPRLDGHYYYAVYDLKKNQIGDKKLIMKADVLKFIYDKQTELNGKFKKIYSELEPKEKDDKVFIVSDDFAKEIAKETESKDGFTHIHANSNFKDTTVSTTEYEKIKDRFKLEYVLDLKTGKTVVNVSYCPPDTKEETEQHATMVMNNLVNVIVSSLPEIVDNLINTGASKALDVPLKKALEIYDKTELKRTVRISVLKSISEAVKSEHYTK